MFCYGIIIFEVVGFGLYKVMFVVVYMIDLVYKDVVNMVFEEVFGN